MAIIWFAAQRSAAPCLFRVFHYHCIKTILLESCVLFESFADVILLKRLPRQTTEYEMAIIMMTILLHNIIVVTTSSASRPHFTLKKPLLSVIESLGISFFFFFFFFFLFFF